MPQNRSIEAALGRRGTLAVFLLLLGVGLVPRLLMLRVPFFFTYDFDWATFGTQAFDMLHGHWRPFMYRQYYMGTAPLLLDCLNFLLFGPTRTALCLTSICYWALYLVSLFWLVRGFWASRLAALLAVASATVGPMAYFFISFQPARGYIDAMALGNVIFLLVLRLLRDGGSRLRDWTLLGLFGGLAFWTSFYSGYYLLPAFVLLLLALPRSFLGPRPWWALAMFFVGSLPLWYFDLVVCGKMVTFGLMESGRDPARVWDNLVRIYDRLSPLLGLRLQWNAEGAAAAVYVFFLLWALLHFLRRFEKPADGGPWWSVPDNAGQFLLLFQAAMVIVLNVYSSRYAGRFLRYLFPLYPFVHVICAVLLADLLYARRRLLAAVLGGAMLIVHYFDSVADNERLTRPEFPDHYARYERMTQELACFAAGRRAPLMVSRVEWDAVNLTFDLIQTGVKVVEPLSPTNALWSVMLDAQAQQLFLERFGSAELFRKYLFSLGFAFKEKVFGASDLVAAFGTGKGVYHFVLFHDLVRAPRALSLIDPVRFSLLPSTNAGHAEWMADGFIDTRWTTAGAARRDEYFDVRFSVPAKVARVLVFSTTNFKEGIHDCRIEVSDDGRTWVSAAAMSGFNDFLTEGSRVYIRPGAGVLEIPLSLDRPWPWYRIRRVGDGLAQLHPWSVNELCLLEENSAAASEPPAVEEPPAGFLAGLVRSGVGTLYADPRTCAAALLEKLPLEVYNVYPWDGIDPRAFVRRRIDLAKKTALVCHAWSGTDTARRLDALGARYERLSWNDRAVFVVEPLAGRPANLFWLDGAVASCFGRRESFALSRAEGKALPALEDLRRALLYFPCNFQALRGLEISGAALSEGQKRILADFTPSVLKSVDFGSAARIAGYSLDRTDEEKMLRLKVFVDVLEDFSAMPELQIFGLSAQGAVYFSPRARAESVFVKRGTDPAPAGERLVYVFSFPRAEAEIWAALLDSGGKRLPVTRSDDPVFLHTRARLCAVGKEG